MQVVWVSLSGLDKAAQGVNSDIASVRYRLAIPAQTLGHKLIYLGPGASRSGAVERFQGAQAAVFGKIMAPPEDFACETERALALMAQLRARGVALLADYCNDHFAHPVFGEGYAAVADVVDGVTACTPALAEAVKRYTCKPVRVITDPVENPQGEPRVAEQQTYQLLWFGNAATFGTLKHAWPQLAAAEVPHRLTVVTSPGFEIPAPCRFRTWSLQAMREELPACDVVVIPADPHDPQNARSPNRFTESLWAGRFVVAHPQPAYEELAEYGWVGKDLGEGLRWYASHPQEAKARIEAGQKTVAARFTPRVVADAWMEAIRCCAQ